jgi:hypothetical protein
MSEEIKKIKEILENHETRIKSLENRIPSPKSEEIAFVEAKIDFEKLAKKIGVSTEKLKELFDMANNALTLLKVAGKDEVEKTKKISLVVLLGYKYFFGNEQVLSKEIRRNVAENRIPVNNFATYLNEMIPSLIRRIGKPKSPKTTYKLTPLGEAEAKEIIKELCK